MAITDPTIKAAYEATLRQQLYLKVADSKAATRVLANKFKNTNVPVVAQVTYRDGVLVITDTTGRAYVGTQADIDDYLSNRQNTMDVYEESERKLSYFKSYAKELGIPQAQIDAIATPTDLERSPLVKDLDAFANKFAGNNRYLPWNPAPVAIETTVTQPFRILPGVVNDPGGAVSPGIATTPLTPSENRIIKNLSGNKTAGGLIGISGPGVGGLSVQGLVMGTNGIKTATSDTSYVVDSASVSSTSDKLTKNVVTFDDSASGADSAGSSTNSAANGLPGGWRNPLEQYESYTYGISLYLITDNEYMLLTQNTQAFTPTNLLVASGGRGPRATEWQDDFYFEDLNVHTISGLNSQTRGSNMLNLDFKIIEPYGLSFIDRLIKTTSRLANKNYAANCYMLQIDFFDSELGQLVNQQKRLPFRIIGLNAKVSSKGSEYRIQGSPFVHHALTNTIAATPVNVTVNAGTLQDFFRPNDAKSAEAGAQAANDKREELAQAAASFQAGATGQGISTQPASAGGTENYVINSYVAAYNAWNQSLVKMKIKPNGGANSISVKFHDYILKGQKIVNTAYENTSVASSPMANPATAQQSKSGATSEKANNQSWTINAGTSIIEVINMVMLSSDYMRNQAITDTTKSGQGPTDWWKVVPSVKIKKYDDTNSVYDFDITYFVMPYKHLNTTHPHLPVATPDKSYAAKIYNYIYSGDNRSVLDFNLEFNYLFFTKVTAIGQDRSTDNPVRDEKIDTEKSGVTQHSTKGSGLGAAPTIHVATDTAGAGKKLAGDRTAQALASAADSIYSNAIGEMIKAQLKIIGDPMWIKQDEVYVDPKVWVYKNTPSAGSDGVGGGYPPDPNSSTNGSLIMDAGDVVCWVDVKVPTDIDDATGGIRQSTQSVFTGAYRALEVTSNFSRGIFTQTLELIRYLNQPADKENNPASSGSRVSALNATERELLNDPNVQMAAANESFGIVGYSSTNNTEQA